LTLRGDNEKITYAAFKRIFQYRAIENLSSGSSCEALTGPLRFSFGPTHQCCWLWKRWRMAPWGWI